MSIAMDRRYPDIAQFRYRMHPKEMGSPGIPACYRRYRGKLVTEEDRPLELGELNLQKGRRNQPVYV